MCSVQQMPWFYLMTVTEKFMSDIHLLYFFIFHHCIHHVFFLSAVTLSKLTVFWVLLIFYKQSQLKYVLAIYDHVKGQRGIS